MLFLKRTTRSGSKFQNFLQKELSQVIKELRISLICMLPYKRWSTDVLVQTGSKKVSEIEKDFLVLSLQVQYDL